MYAKGYGLVHRVLARPLRVEPLANDDDTHVTATSANAPATTDSTITT